MTGPAVPVGNRADRGHVEGLPTDLLAPRPRHPEVSSMLRRQSSRQRKTDARYELLVKLETRLFDDAAALRDPTCRAQSLLEANSSRARS